ncbi:hypothetical protein Tco_0930949 [Tanacetum coccineum]
MDQVTKHTPVKVSSDHKRKFDDRRTFNNNNNCNINTNNRYNNSQHNKRQETFRAYAATPTENNGYIGNRPLCTNTVIQGFTLTLLNQPFEIDLMSIKLGSFDVVIGMDWLSKYHAKSVMRKGCQVFIAQVMEKKSDDKRLEDIPVVREFLEFFPEELPGLPPVR